MDGVRIDKEKCTGCEICAGNCPYRAIGLEDGKAVYTLDSCFLCGQCLAVCPVDAIRLPGFHLELGLATMAETRDVVSSGSVSSTEIVALMRSRRSCRTYREEALPQDILTDLVKIGTTAPSGTNSQAWNFTILPTREDLQIFGGMVADYYRGLNRLAEKPLLRTLVKIFGGDSLGRYYRNYYGSVAEALGEWDEEGMDRLFHGAVAAILVTGKKDASCPAEDALLATQNILLAAHTMGLGSCLIGFGVQAMRRSPQIKKKMELTDDEEIYSIIALGYPAITFLRPTVRKVVVPRILNLAEGLS